MITYVVSCAGLSFTLLLGVALKNDSPVVWPDRFLFWIALFGFLSLPSGAIHELLTNVHLDGGATFLLRCVAGLGYLTALVLFCARVAREETRFDSEFAGRIPHTVDVIADIWNPTNYLFPRID